MTEISFAELCIWGALWGLFDVTRQRLFHFNGHFLSKEEFLNMGFKVMLPPATLLRVGTAGWPYTVLTEPPRVPAKANLLNARNMMGLG